MPRDDEPVSPRGPGSGVVHAYAPRSPNGTIGDGLAGLEPERPVEE